MAFDKTVNGVTVHDFGSIVFGANGKVDFTFTNKGTKPLIISDVKSSCGCTVPSWTKEPVEPGKTGVIKIVYDTKEGGVFHKIVEVFSNADNSPVKLEIRGKVNSKPSDQNLSNSRGGSLVKISGNPFDSKKPVGQKAVTSEKKTGGNEELKK